MPPRIAYATQGRFDLLGLDEPGTNTDSEDEQEEAVITTPVDQQQQIAQDEKPVQVAQPKKKK